MVYFFVLDALMSSFLKFSLFKVELFSQESQVIGKLVVFFVISQGAGLGFDLRQSRDFRQVRRLVVESSESESGLKFLVSSVRSVLLMRDAFGGFVVGQGFVSVQEEKESVVSLWFLGEEVFFLIKQDGFQREFLESLGQQFVESIYFTVGGEGMFRFVRKVLLFTFSSIFFQFNFFVQNEGQNFSFFGGRDFFLSVVFIFQ